MWCSIYQVEVARTMARKSKDKNNEKTKPPKKQKDSK